MLPKLSREFALLCVPVLLIGGGAWWRNKNGPPEDIWSGKARLLTRVKQLDATPIDLYGGYTRMIEIDQWAAGELTPTPTPRAGAMRTCRDIIPCQSPLYVAYRQGKNWKRTLSISELVEHITDKSLKTPSVNFAVACLKLETIDSVSHDRGKFTSRYVLRLPTSPRVEEAFLIGTTQARVQDRDDRMVRGVNTGEIIGGSRLTSEPIKVRLLTHD